MPATILQISDIHLRGDGRPVNERDPAERLSLAVDAFRRRTERADLILLSGDQSDDGELAAMRSVHDLLAPAGAPLLAIKGNHDGSPSHEQAFGAGAHAELGAWRVIGLDSSIPGEIHGAVDVAAMERLLDSLDARPTLIAIHHPPIPPTPHPWFHLENAPQMLAALAARTHVRCVLSGHVHSPFELVRGSLTLLGAPSTLVAFDFASPGGAVKVARGGPTGARLLALHDDGSLESSLILT